MSLSQQEIRAGRANKQIGTHLVKETPSMSIWHVRLAPGERLEPHYHDRPYFWTVLTDGTGRSQFDDGRDIAITYKAGDTGYFPDLSKENTFAHDLINSGDTELLFVTVEFNQNQSLT